MLKLQADPENFAAEMDMASADAILLPGLLTRLPRPAAFLDALAPPLRPGGVVAIATDYGWDPSVTRHAEWLLPTGGEQQVGSFSFASRYCESLGSGDGQ